jgi:hypothetical protein
MKDRWVFMLLLTAAIVAAYFGDWLYDWLKKPDPFEYIRLRPWIVWGFNLLTGAFLIASLWNAVGGSRLERYKFIVCAVVGLALVLLTSPLFVLASLGFVPIWLRYLLSPFHPLSWVGAIYLFFGLGGLLMRSTRAET